MAFKFSFYIAFAIFIIGTVYRIRPWFSYTVGPEAGRFSSLSRVKHSLTALLTTAFSLKIFRLIFSFVVDVVFQFQILKKDGLRWFMHFSIFAGFMLLLFMHALEDFISVPLFSDYASTLNPYMFLRDLAGLMVIIGLIIAAWRRHAVKPLKRITNSADKFALALLAVIIVSGFLLESAKIVSPSIFNDMVDEYTFGMDDPESVMPLKAFWAKEFGMAFPGEDISFNDDLLEEGMEIHEDSCASCHSKPAWAFVSYPVSKALKPIAGPLDRIHVDVLLWYLHFLACFIGLALLPFTKFFHIISTPVSLLVNGVVGRRPIKPVNRVTRRALDLDGCTHCGTCSVHCSVAPVYRLIENENILPSEKLASLKRMASGKPAPTGFLNAFAEGSYICTNCYRCTLLCPSGLNLQDLWLSSREDLVEKGRPRPDIRILEKNRQKEPADMLAPLQIKPQKDVILNKLINVSISAETLSGCFRCKTCTNSCPVVACYDNPQESLGMVPHQIMHALGFGLGNMVIDTKMIWACTTCYLCQEHCPQGVKVTDILYGLKNIAYDQVKEV